MRREVSALALVLGLLPTVPAPAAPAPPPRLGSAEAVVAYTGPDARQAASRLHSALVLDAVVRAREGRRLGCLAREKDPAVWLAARLRARVVRGGRAIAIRVVDCPRKDALPLVWAVVGAYQTHVCPERSFLDDAGARLDEALRARIKGRAADHDVHAAEARLRAAEARLKAVVLQPPRLVSAEG
jgi:hypothetical protein